MLLYIKHLVIGSPLEAPSLFLRKISRLMCLVKHPELLPILLEDGYIDRILERLLVKDSVCVDIGCHIGSFLNKIQKYAPNGAHIAFEPSPTKSAWLKKKFARTIIHECALSDRSGEAIFYEDKVTPGYSGLSNRGLDNLRFNQRVVSLRTLDDLLEDRRDITLMKIDVEGAELNVLKGGRNIIERCRPYLIFECGPKAAEKRVGFSGAELFEFLTDELGYEVYTAMDYCFHKPSLTLPEFQSGRIFPFRGFNYIAVPRVAAA